MGHLLFISGIGMHEVLAITLAVLLFFAGLGQGLMKS